MKKLVALLLVLVMVLGLAACGVNTDPATEPSAPATEPSAPATESPTPTEGEFVVPGITEIKVGEDYTDLTATIEYFHGRTDRENDGTFDKLIAEFNKLYPNITVEHSATTNMADDLMMRITSGDYPTLFRNCAALTPDTYKDYVTPWDTVDAIKGAYDGSSYSADGYVYGLAFELNSYGFVYNKAVFAEAGITELPTTPDEFIAALKAIKDNTDAIPMYTNYKDKWPLTVWSDMCNAATGDSAYNHVTRTYTADPVAEGTAAREVYKMLWDAVAGGYTEEDFSTTDWEASKNWLNEGGIGCIMIPSWYYAQACAAGESDEDLAFMAFPTMSGKTYNMVGGGDHHFINVNATPEEQTAAKIFYKWFIEESSFMDDEMKIRPNKGAAYPEFLSAVADLPIVGRDTGTPEDAQNLADMMTETENLFLGGDCIMYLIEAAATGIDTFGNIMDKWNTQWNDAQATLGLTTR